MQNIKWSNNQDNNDKEKMAMGKKLRMAAQFR